MSGERGLEMEDLRLALFNGQEVPLQPGRIRIGRGADNDVALNITRMSRHHAEIRFDGRDCLLVDLKSTNGTTLNGQPLRPYQAYPMQPGSSVSMGGQQVFRLEASPVFGDLGLYVDDYAGETVSPRTSTSPWVFVLGGLAIVLVAALAVLTFFLLKGGGDEAAQEMTPTDTPIVEVAPTDTSATTGSETQPTSESLLPTVTIEPVPTVEVPAPGGGEPPPAQPPDEQPSPPPDVVPTVQGWATSLAPLFPTGTPGALPGQERYPAPELVSPSNGNSFHGEDADVILIWKSVGTLKGDEYYRVSVRYSQLGEARYAGDWVQGTEWRMPQRFAGEADQGRFEWDVTVYQATTIRSDGTKDGPAISPKSETWSFTWSGGGGDEPQSPGGRPGEPSATPEIQK
jgi:hypothetical protein